MQTKRSRVFIMAESELAHPYMLKMAESGHAGRTIASLRPPMPSLGLPSASTDKAGCWRSAIIRPFGLSNRFKGLTIKPQGG